MEAIRAPWEKKKKKKKDRWAGGGKATTFRKYPPSSAGNESNSGVSGTHCSLETPFAAEHRPPVRRGQPGMTPTAGSSGASKSFTAPGRPLPFTLPAFSVLCPRPAESGCDLATPTPPVLSCMLRVEMQGRRRQESSQETSELGCAPVPSPSPYRSPSAVCKGKPRAGGCRGREGGGEGGREGGDPCLPRQHRPWHSERGSGQSSTAGCGQRGRGRGGPRAAPDPWGGWTGTWGGPSCRGRAREGLGWHRRPPMGASGGRPRGSAQLGGGSAGRRRPEERTGAGRPRSRGKSLPAGRRRPSCSGEGFPLDVCTANGWRRLRPHPGVSPPRATLQPL